MKKLVFLIIASVIFFTPQISNAQGCMDSDSEDGVKVIGYLQPEFRYDFYGDDIYGESIDENSFYFNRVRLGVVGNVPYDFSYYAISELSATKGGPMILDAFVTYNRFGPYAKISFGQFKNPFGLELNTPCHKLHTIQRSQVVNDLAGPFRDFGVLIYGGTDSLSILGSTTKNLFGYSVALLNGNGPNIYDDNQFKDIVGRVTFHPIKYLTLGASYRYGKHPAAVATAEKEDERSRFGFDAEVKIANLLVQGEYIKGKDVGSYTTGGGCGGPLEVHEGSVERDGYFVQAMYNTPWNIQPVVKYQYYEPNMAADVLNDQVSSIIYGVNIFPNEWTRVQINYLYNIEESGIVEHPNDALLIQAQIEF